MNLFAMNAGHHASLSSVSRKHHSTAWLLAASCLVAGAVQAAEPPLAQGTVPGAGTVQISPADVAADIQRIPVEVRPQVLTQTRTMNKLVTNLYTRRALAQRAETQGLDKQPEVAAALALARDKVLSDALLVQVDAGNTPPDDKVEGMARVMYQANSKDFQRPEQVRARHILIAAQGEDTAAEKKARDILAQLRAGGDFAALARQHSADPGSANKGGDLGFFARERMVPEFAEAAFGMQKQGELSDVVKTQFGYHILQFEERQPAGQQPFDEVKEGLVAKVKQSEQQKGRNALAEQLESTIKLDEAAVKATVEKLTQPSVAQKP